ncbi:MAG TPA: hypothetical protein PKE16_08175 [Hyphomicrobium sp.]|nr:hypothetical protein [Hyphomicrobium sp.]
MTKKFYAEILTRSERDRTNGRLEVSLCDIAGECHTISLGADVVAALASLIAETPIRPDMTKIPDHFAVGHGRHEPVVMLRFEDDPAYGLTAAQAIDLGAALIEEAETITTNVKYPARQ